VIHPAIAVKEPIPVTTARPTARTRRRDQSGVVSHPFGSEPVTGQIHECLRHDRRNVAIFLLDLLKKLGDALSSLSGPVPIRSQNSRAT
jgi:hypothetical protein